MRWSLKVLRRTRSLKRRLFGQETPHWASDLYRACKFFNAIELMPTILAILCAPDHFFRRRELITQKRSFGVKTVYRSPVGFAGRIVTLMFGGVLLKQVAVPQMAIASGVFLSFLSVPLLVPLLCLIFILFGLPIKTLTYRDEGWGQSQNTTLFWLGIPTAPSTYRQFDWRSFFWSLFYLYGYLLTMAIVVIMTAVIAGMVIGLAVSLAYANNDIGKLSQGLYILKLRLGLWLGLLGMWLFARIAIYPYIAMLVACARKPSLLMLTCRHYDVRISVRKLKAALVNYQTHSVKTILSTLWLKEAKRMRAEIESLAQRLDHQLQALRQHMPDVQSDSKAATALVFRALGSAELGLSIQRAPANSIASTLLDRLQMPDSGTWIRFPIIDEWDAKTLTASLDRYRSVLTLAFTSKVLDSGYVFASNRRLPEDRQANDLAGIIAVSIEHARASDAENGMNERSPTALNYHLGETIPLAFKCLLAL